MGSHVPTGIPSYFTNPSQIAANHTKQNDIYQAMDTVQQYLEHFSNYRKQTKAPIAGAGVGTNTSRAWIDKFQ